MSHTHSEAVNETCDVSVVIPCLNEAATIGACVSRARDAMRSAALCGEVIVADNGSSDESREIALAQGARVVDADVPGYGSALMAGIAAARSRYIVMGDADGSYDLGETPQFVSKLRAGFSLVQGCRLPSGGGTVAPRAMPWLHRWIGNPLLSFLARMMFRTPVHDVYCGLRGFSKPAYEALNLRCTGMEFATEMIIRAAQCRLPTSELPITLHRDGREGRGSHLRTFRDGWRTLRLFLLYSPRWLLLFPSLALIGVGSIGAIAAWWGARLGNATLGPHTLLVSVAMILVGYQAFLFAIFTRTLAWRAKFAPPSPLLNRFYKSFTLERGLMASGLSLAAGLTLICIVAVRWAQKDFGPLAYQETMRLVVPGVLLVALAGQTFFGSFAVSLSSLERR